MSGPLSRRQFLPGLVGLASAACGIQRADAVINEDTRGVLSDHELLELVAPTVRRDIPWQDLCEVALATARALDFHVVPTTHQAMSATGASAIYRDGELFGFGEMSDALAHGMRTGEALRHRSASERRKMRGHRD